MAQLALCIRTSAGIQYWHLRLHISVREIRRYVCARPSVSVSRASRAVLSWEPKSGGAASWPLACFGTAVANMPVLVPIGRPAARQRPALGDNPKTTGVQAWRTRLRGTLASPSATLQLHHMAPEGCVCVCHSRGLAVTVDLAERQQASAGSPLEEALRPIQTLGAHSSCLGRIGTARNTTTMATTQLLLPMLWVPPGTAVGS